MRHAYACLALLAVGCASRIDDPAILPYGGRDGAVPSSDGGVTVSCRDILTAIPIDTIQIVDELTALTDGATIRVRLFYQRPSCWIPATTDVVLQSNNGTANVALTTYLWKHDPLPGEECGTINDSRVVSISDAIPAGLAPIMIVKDLESATQVKAVVAPRPMTAGCDKTALGDKCQLDCQCWSANLNARCLVGWNRCGYPCAEQVDCPAGMMCDALGKTTPVFGMCTPGNQCANPPDCLRGEDCSVTPKGNVCTPFPASTGGSCACNANCDSNRICTGDGTCEVPCTTSSECPPSIPHCESGACKAI
jgi:hypothetical protein